MFFKILCVFFKVISKPMCQRNGFKHHNMIICNMSSITVNLRYNLIIKCFVCVCVFVYKANAIRYELPKQAAVISST